MDSHYPTITEWSEDDQAFITLVPDLPGCFADGPSRQEAARNAEAVIQMWLEAARKAGQHIPTPSRHLVSV